MSAAYRCHLCGQSPAWRIVRRGDAVVSWTCDGDLPALCHKLQRGFEETELVLTQIKGKPSIS